MPSWMLLDASLGPCTAAAQRPASNVRRFGQCLSLAHAVPLVRHVLVRHDASVGSLGLSLR